jgi:hypothetical protein
MLRAREPPLKEKEPLKEPLKVELGTIIYDREWPEDMGIICAKDEERDMYLVRWWNWGDFNGIWIKARYIELSCSELTTEGLPLYYERVSASIEQYEKGKEYHDWNAVGYDLKELWGALGEREEE